MQHPTPLSTLHPTPAELDAVRAEVLAGTTIGDLLDAISTLPDAEADALLAAARSALHGDPAGPPALGHIIHAALAAYMDALAAREVERYVLEYPERRALELADQGVLVDWRI